MLHGAERNRFDLSFCLPSECADRLASGRADIGIVPSVELSRQNLEVIPGAGIACRGPVRSILLISKVPPGQICTLAADSSSRASTVLARILLAHRYGVEPLFLHQAPDLPSMLEAADAALIIGDPALRLDPAGLPFLVLDLGEEWAGMTGLPMVFAVWAGAKECVTPDLVEPFLSSCRFGLAHLDDIVLLESERRNLPETLTRRYLTRHIVFEIGAREEEGLRLFLQYARQFDIVVSSGKASA